MANVNAIPIILIMMIAFTIMLTAKIALNKMEIVNIFSLFPNATVIKMKRKEGIIVLWYFV
jgi:hypothetical protein